MPTFDKSIRTRERRILPNYRRNVIPGATYFFTVNLLERHHNDLLVREIERLRQAIRHVRSMRPFHIDGWVVLPEHMHTIWTLPAGEHDYSQRWSAIKAIFSRSLPSGERCSPVRQARGERGIWQRRFWEHTIKDESDYARHMDYLYFNPVKHGHVHRVQDWPYSTFHHLVAAGIYPREWSGGEQEVDTVGE